MLSWPMLCESRLTQAYLYNGHVMCMFVSVCMKANKSVLDAQTV